MQLPFKKPDKKQSMIAIILLAAGAAIGGFCGQALTWLATFF